MIESVLKQHYSKLELIIVNDGSTDNSLTIIQDYALIDDRIKVIDEPNSGKPSIVRNKGIKVATGDIITFLDADDIYSLERLELIVDAFTKHPQCSVVIHDFNRISETGEVMSNGLIKEKWKSHGMSNFFENKNNTLISKKDIYLAFLESWFFVHTTSIAFKKLDYYKSYILFDESLLYFEDLNKWCELVVNKKIIYLDKVLSSYRDTPGSLMSDSALFNLSEIEFFKKHLLSPLIEIPESTQKKLMLKQYSAVKDALFSFSSKGDIIKTLSLSKILLKINLNVKNLIIVIKYSIISISKHFT